MKSGGMLKKKVNPIHLLEQRRICKNGRKFSTKRFGELLEFDVFDIKRLVTSYFDAKWDIIKGQRV